MTRLLLLLAALYGFWTYGIDGLRVSLQGRNPKVYSAEQVIAQGGVGGARYVRITGFTDSTYVFQTPDKESGDKAKTVNRIEYALLPQEEMLTSMKAVMKGEKHVTPIHIMVSDSRISSGCQSEKTEELGDGCLQAGPKTVEGIVRFGLDALDSETRNLFEKDGDYKVSKEVLYITEGDRPSALWVPILVILGLGIAILVLGLSFLGGGKSTDSPAEA